MRIVLLICSVIALASATAWAQSAGQLTGIVRDASGAVLRGVKVTATGPALPVDREALTNDQGRYTFDNLPAGSYVVNAVLTGFVARPAKVQVPAEGAMLDLVLDISTHLERVTVTAARTGVTDVQSMPIAMTVVNDRALEQLAVHTIEGLAGMVPTLTISQNTGLAQVTIRGIGTNAVFAGSDPSSTMHLDGVYLARPAMMLADLMDVERVEVLRGPQGTLYGRNSVGGTINLISKPASPKTEARGRFTAGDFGQLRAEGTVGGAIVKDKVLARASFVRSVRDGFIANLTRPDEALGGEDLTGGRVQLQVPVTSTGALQLSFDHARARPVPLTYAKVLAIKPGFENRISNPASLYEVRTSSESWSDNRQRGGAARLTLQLAPALTLTSLTAYRRSDYGLQIDGDFTELPALEINLQDGQRQFSEEVTIVRRTARVTWFGGVFYFKEHEGQPTSVRSSIGENRFAPEVDTESRAAFADATMQLSSRVALVGGIRYTNETKALETSGGSYPPGAPFQLSGFSFTEEAKHDGWTPRAAVEVRAAPDTMVYFSVTRGFKSGGFNYAARAAGAGFRPEFALSYEAGLKSTIAHGRARINTAVFVNDYTDLQVQTFLRPGVVDISNAPGATIGGVEVEAAALVAKGLQLEGGLAWLDATYDQYLAQGLAGFTQEVAGNRLNNAPGWSGAASAIYNISPAFGGTMSIAGHVSWQSRVFFTPFNDAIESQGAYGLLHLRAAYESRARHWGIAAFVRNVTATPFVTGTIGVAPTAIGGRPGERRHWGTELTLRY